MAAYGFLLDEDNALKSKLLNQPNGVYSPPNFFVTNYKDGQQIPVDVFFRSPDTEIRSRTFPHFAIDLIDVQPDHERMHRADGPIVPYPTETATPTAGFPLVADDFPFPWMLYYQISAISRDPTHDRQLGQLLFRMFPYQYGSLDMTNFDGTVRRADFVEMERRDLPADANNKRLYRQVFTIGVSSEFYLNQIVQIQQVISVNLTVEEQQGSFAA
jgi:hypothetical protein